MYTTSDYNERGQCVQSTDYDADGALTQYDVWEYDESGKLLSKTRYNGDGTVENITTYE